ncbi:adenylate/guanylate cyclase domain-containing protein [Phaeobacter porticola]|uniref:Adenylate cyclase domain-containing protein n=1 Tax=Phaeobacter porticola TaxID=1844006 RepID=A0A1L3I0T4_9RHOB|nr:adenylate/guanylate cyclase domain-containing protein [Phaeobacter porticola]APG45728.1 adenylate cyclase domain-containing protein [Phaeobacter porticola]
MTDADLRATLTIDWITSEGLRGASRQEMLQGYCQRLVDCGVPLFRFHLAQRAYHPKYGGIGFSWTRADGLTHEYYEHSETPRDEWLYSTFYYMLERKVPEFRSKLTGHVLERFPALAQFKQRGATDYFALAKRFGDFADAPFDPRRPGEGVLSSWTTDQSAGFDEADLMLIRLTYPHLALALRAASAQQMAKDLLQVYLGRDAGQRVLSGEIQRGSSRQIDAVICYFDLKGFTQLAEQIPGADLIDMLNDYFGLAVHTIQTHGGNILKFMGDGILSMFDLGSIDEDATAALDAASDLQRKIRQRNDERADKGVPVADFTLALHAGEILYGNIGSENRLDFTVIGPTVNLTARISGMHTSVGRSIIVSEQVQRAAQPTNHDLVSLGRYMLRGVAEPVELFTIHESAALAQRDDFTE